MWRDLVINHADLQVWIYANLTLADLARPSLITVFVVLIAGLLIAILKDVQWSRSRRHGRRLRGSELVSVPQFNRRTRADGISFIQTPRLSAKLLGVQPALAIPRIIESSPRSRLQSDRDRRRDVRPLQPRELYRTQEFATAVYRSELAARHSLPGG